MSQADAIRTDSSPIVRLFSNDVSDEVFDVEDNDVFTITDLVNRSGVIGLDGEIAGQLDANRVAQGKRGLPDLYVTGSEDNDVIECAIFALDEFSSGFDNRAKSDSLYIARLWNTITFTIGAATGSGSSAALGASVLIADTVTLGTPSAFGAWLNARYVTGWSRFSPGSNGIGVAACMDLADRSGILFSLRNTTAARACNAWARVAT